MKWLNTNIRQLVAFFIIAYLLTWSTWIPAFLNPDRFPKQIVFIGLFAPAISALMVSGLAGGGMGMWNVLKRYLIWRVHWKWYLLALLLIPFLFILLALILLKANPQNLWIRNSWLFVAASFLFLMIINSGEEIGWRGFALPRLQAAFGNSLIASIVLGFIWGMWHLPEYLIPGQSSFPFPIFLLFTTGVSIIYTVLFNRSSGSLLVAVLFHVSADIMPRIMNIVVFSASTWFWIAWLTWIAAILLYWFTRRESIITE